MDVWTDRQTDIHSYRKADELWQHCHLKPDLLVFPEVLQEHVVAFGVALHLQLGGPVGRSLDLLKHLDLLGGEVRRRSAVDVIKRFFLVRRSGKISRFCPWQGSTARPNIGE